MSKFTHLHAHDEYSLLDGLGIVADNVAVAAERGFTSMAQTNHGSMDGAMKFKQACEKNGIKPVFGVELYFVDDLTVKVKGEKRRHLTVLVKNEEGFKSINRILTRAHLDGFYYNARADKSLILDNTEGLIVLSGCASGALRDDGDTEFIYNLHEALGDDFYLEVMPLDFDLQYGINMSAANLSEGLGVPIVSTNDVHYATAEDAKLHEVLLAIQSGAKWDDPNRWRYSVTGLYQKTYDEMLQSWKQMGECPFSNREIIDSLLITQEIVEKCEFDLPGHEPRLPSAPVIIKSDKEPSAILMELCMEGFDKLVDEREEEYMRRLAYELEIIIKLGFEKYFLMVEDLVSWCKKNGIMVGPGRGSIGGCLIAYLLGITTVDPIEYDLKFERFITPDRIDLPDIDLDFDKYRRDEVIQYLKGTYGSDCVAQISTFGHLGGRSALRDVARVFDVPYAHVDKAAKSIPDKPSEQIRPGHTIEDAFNTFEEGKKFKREYPEVTELAIKLEGQIRHAGMHAAGVVVSSEPFDKGDMGHLTRRGKDKESDVIVWDMRDLEHFGLIKLDILGLTNLSILDRCKRLIKREHNVDVIFEDIPFTDPDVLNEFDKGNTACTFQFGSKGIQKFITQVGVSDFQDLYDINALFRPGPLRSGVSEQYINRKHADERVDFLHPALRDATGDTFGLIIYQEQVMESVRELAGFTWSESDKMRKVIGKSKGVAAFNVFKDKFIDGCVESGLLRKGEAENIFEQLKHYGSYGFNKSHAVEYSMIGYYDMWCKVYYPVEYMAAMLSMDDDVDAMVDNIREARRLGIKVSMPSINKSDAQYWEIAYEDDGTPILVCPLLEVKGIGEKTAAELAKAKSEVGVFETLEQLNDAVDKRKVNKRAIDALTAVGALDELSDVDSEDRSETAGDYLSWDIVSPMLAFRSFLSRASESLNIVTISDIVNDDVDKYPAYVSGRVVDLELKYQKRQAGEAKVNAVLQDDDTFIQVQFDSSVLEKHKEVVENLEDEFVLFYGEKRFESFFVKKLWNLSDVLIGEFGADGGLPLLNSMASIDEVVAQGIKICDACDLRQDCIAPVPYSPGQLPAMIVGEAPGQDEDKQGMGFVGKAGTELFKALGLDRELFHVTNVVHCRPLDNRDPTKKEIKGCTDLWLDLEIKELKPVVILALGNVPLGFFTGKGSGIMQRNAQVEWNDQYGAWVVFGIHPAAILYQRDHLELLERACDQFVSLISKVAT